MAEGVRLLGQDYRPISGCGHIQLADHQDDGDTYVYVEIVSAGGYRYLQPLKIGSNV